MGLQQEATSTLLAEDNILRYAHTAICASTQAIYCASIFAGLFIYSRLDLNVLQRG